MLQLALLLWIARVPVFMTAFGFVLLGKAPQAQDLFLDFSTTWSWPASLAAGLDPGFLADLARSVARMVLFVVILGVFWAMPTHYAARLLLDTDARLRQLVAAQPHGQTSCLRSMERCVPRLLGSLTFVAVLLGIWRSQANIPLLDETEVTRAANISLAILALLVLAGLACFYRYVVRRPRDADLPILRSIKALNRPLASFWRAVWPGARDHSPGGQEREASRDVGRLLFTVAFAVFVSIMLRGADFAAWLFPRAMAIPFIVGGWMPFLTYVSAAGRQLRAPLIFGLFVVVGGLVILIGDNHSVRRINAAKVAGHPVDTSRITLNAALKLWMAESCTSRTAENGTTQDCPRPIIVASAGGASRAAFFMSSVIGRLMLEAPNHGLSPNDIRNRLFAISSVSGSSVGAVMVTAALDARIDAAKHPCAEKPLPLWWGIKVGNWQDCFEALTSGDFLTPVFFGFAFNDMFPFAWRDRAAVLEDSWSARFDAIVTQRDRTDDKPACKGLNCPFLALRPRSKHWIPLLVLNGTSEATGGRIVTTLLASNYTPSGRCPTSPAQTGGCTLFTEADHFHDLLATQNDPALDGWTGAIERGFLRWRHGETNFNDVRLSTAAHNSARFPFVSPPGAVRNGSQQVVDRIVDGGYFENYGAISANELALAIRAINPQLSPLVIVISNDPDDLLNPSLDSDAAPYRLRLPALVAAKRSVARQRLTQYLVQQGRTRARVSGSEPLPDLVTTVTAFAHAWPAHGTLAVEDFRSWLHQANTSCPVQLVHIRVWPQILTTGEASSRAVSMSWWLSMPVQRHLHQQMEDVKNQNFNGPRFNAIWSATAGNGGCAAPQGQDASR